MLLMSQGIHTWIQSLCQGNWRETKIKTQQRVLKRAGNRSEVMCVTVQEAAAKQQRGVENQLDRTRLDIHDMQI